MGGGKVAAQGTKKNRFLSDFDEILPRSLRTTLPPLTSKLSPTTTTTNTTTKNSCFRNARRNEKLQAGNTRVLCFSGKTTFASGFAILCFHFCCFFLQFCCQNVSFNRTTATATQSSASFRCRRILLGKSFGKNVKIIQHK